MIYILPYSKGGESQDSPPFVFMSALYFKGWRRFLT